MDQANQMPMQGTPKKSVGPIVGIIIIVIVLVIGAFYFWGAELNQTPAPATASPLSESDELTDISADLSATAINGIDDSVSAMEAEVDAQN